jgi:hypothetical protein
MDRAVYMFGSAMEDDIETAVSARKTNSAKALVRTTRMNTWLGLRQYRQPTT